jgi:hypothetical protein
MKHYSPKEVNRIKQEIRTGKPLPIIADELSVEFDRPLSGLYTKIVLLARQTRKINKTWEGPTRKPYKKRASKSVAVQEMIDFEPLPGSTLSAFKNPIEEVIKEVKAVDTLGIVQEICEEIVSKPIEREPAEIGIEVPVGVMAFTGTPSRVVVYSDHVRYYFDN